MKNRLIAALVVALITLCVVNALGATDQFGLPTELPIGSRQAMLEWDCTNRNSTLLLSITFTNTANQPVTRGAPIVSDAYLFTSYFAYKQIMVTNAIHLLNTYRAVMSPTTTVTVSSTVFYDSISAACFQANTNLGPLSTITSNSFWLVEPYYVDAVMPVSGLNFFRIEVEIGESQTYAYVWTPQVNYSQQTLVPPNPYPKEITAVNKIVFHEWYSIGEARARFDCGNNLKTNRYTQFGDALVGRKLSISTNCLKLAVPRGADVILESSGNLLNWGEVAYFPSSLGANLIIVPLDVTQCRQQYFRVNTW